MERSRRRNVADVSDGDLAAALAIGGRWDGRGRDDGFGDGNGRTLRLSLVRMTRLTLEREKARGGRCRAVGGRARAQGWSDSTTLAKKGNCAGLDVSGVLGGVPGIGWRS